MDIQLYLVCEQTTCRTEQTFPPPPPHFFPPYQQKPYLISVAVFGIEVLSLKIKEHVGGTVDAN
jgi:hypothetical protein